MSSEPAKRLDPTITAALIGVVGTIVVTLITVFGNRPPAAQPTPVPPTAVVYTETVAPTAQPTDTVPAGDNTSTPEPPTNTPEPIPTATLIPVGADWSQNCISAVWIPYPSDTTANSDDKGCLLQPVDDKFYTTSDKLAFSFDERMNSSQFYGLFAKLPSDGTVRIDLRPITVRRGEIVMGVFASPDINSDGVIITLPASNDVTKRQKFFMKTMPGQRRFAESIEMNENPSVYDVVFDYNSGSITAVVYKGQSELGTVTVVSGEKWLFLGFQALNGGTNTLQAEFQSLEIQAR
jgi:hypothetical protein